MDAPFSVIIPGSVKLSAKICGMARVAETMLGSASVNSHRWPSNSHRWPGNSHRWLWEANCAASLLLALPFVGRFVLSVILIGFLTIGVLILLQLPLLVAFLYVRNAHANRAADQRRLRRMLGAPSL